MVVRKVQQFICPRCSREEPDGFVWETDNGGFMWSCGLCDKQDPQSAPNVWSAHESVHAHLRHVHGERRVYVETDRPAWVKAVQLAMSLALPLKSRRDHTRYEP